LNKKLLAAAISGALVAPMAAQAIDFKVSGQVNRMIRFVDDGVASDIQQTDNTASRSRFRFVGSGDVGNGMKAGVNYEIGMASALSSASPIKAGEGGTPDSFDGGADIRHSAIWFSGDWGKVTMGHTSESNDGVAFADNSGTGLVDEAATVEHCSSCAVRTSGGGFSGVSFAGMRGSYDGGRTDVLRYDSPAFGPATVTGSVGNNERYAVGAFIDHEVGGGNLSVYGGYRRNQSVDDWAISGSFLFSQGTSITATYGERDREGGGAAGRTSENVYVKLGHKWGNNAVSASWGETVDHAANGVDGSTWGVGWVHTLSKPGINLYAGYHHLDNDASAAGIANLGLAAGTQLEDADMFVVGSRIQFK
jgi:predicted porin